MSKAVKEKIRFVLNEFGIEPTKTMDQLTTKERKLLINFLYLLEKEAKKNKGGQ